MKILETIGIDISKLTFDVRIHSNQFYKQFENNDDGYDKLTKWAYKNSSFTKKNILFAFEHTGLYSHNLAVYLTTKEIAFSLIPGLEIKRSLGIARGKDDKVDATKIALYAFRLRDEIKPYTMPSSDIISLKNLLSLRDRIVKQKAGFVASLKEQSRILKNDGNETLFLTQEKMIVFLSEQIEEIDNELSKIIKNDDLLKEQYKLIVSIKGVGKQTALHMIAYTSAFTLFNTWRQFASYAGIAPFPNSSGTSIFGKTKVNNLANKKLKTLLDLCAKSAKQHNLEMKKYYDRRIEIGKNKMSTINIIRNKIVARIFAVIERKSPYVDFLKYAS